MQEEQPGGSAGREPGTRMRWVVIALAGVAVLTALTWVPVEQRSLVPETAQAGGVGADGMPAAATGAGGCAADAPLADLDLTLKDMHGRDVRLVDLKGRVILLNFWATWCGPCRFEIPTLVELQDRYRARGLEVLGISVDDPMESLPPFAREYRLNYKVLVGRDRDDVQEAFGPIMGVPTTVFIGRNGRICGRHVGLASKADLEQEIKGLL